MRRAERVVLALAALGEARQSAALAQGADAVSPAGQDLVRIGLVADVPDQDVFRRLIDVVKRHREFDHAETGAEVPAGLRHHVDHFGPQFIGQLAQFRRAETAHVAGIRNLVEQGRDWRHIVVVLDLVPAI